MIKKRDQEKKSLKQFLLEKLSMVLGDRKMKCSPMRARKKFLFLRSKEFHIEGLGILKRMSREVKVLRKV